MDRQHKVLLVEHDDDVREMVADWLSFDGYDVILASNGIDGLKELSIHRPDLIIAGVEMPIMDGFEFCRRAKQATSGPIITFSGRPEPESRSASLNVGADVHLTKSVGMDDFLGTVKNLLG